MKNYNMYIYYKGSDDYPNKKAAFFGSYEKAFEYSYKGMPEDKEESFKEFMCNLLYEQASDIYIFGLPDVDKSKCFKEYLKTYFDPEFHLEYYEGS